MTFKIILIIVIIKKKKRGRLFMKNVRKISEDIYWVGGSDRRLARFENIFPIAKGVSYNAYLLLDEKTVLLDTADKGIAGVFLENVTSVLTGRILDYLVVNHMEPDHCAMIEELILRYPDLKIIGNIKTFQIMKQFFDFDVDSRSQVIKEGDTFCSGKHNLQFLMAPMVHWPEVMVTYDETQKILFSADGFGSFGALNGNIFNDEIDIEHEWLDETRRYYTNIVGKYGPSVQALLKKTAALDMEMICPLHGPIWRTNLEYLIEKYQKWSTYVPEERAVAIIYASMYGDTELAVNVLASRLADAGVKKIAVYDVSSTDMSVLISEIFRCSHLVMAAPTYNGGIYPLMDNLLHDMLALNVQNRTVALMENGTWAPVTVKRMSAQLEEMKNMEILDTSISIKSALKDSQEIQMDELCQAIVNSLNA